MPPIVTPRPLLPFSRSADPALQGPFRPLPFDLRLSWTPLTVPAGFPSPAEDHAESEIDLAAELIRHPAATFTFRITGRSLERAGIHDGDLALADRAETPRDGDIVIAVVDGAFTVKRLRIAGAGHGFPAPRAWLVPDSDDPSYRPIEITGRDDVTIWAVVTVTVRRHREVTGGDAGNRRQAARDRKSRGPGDNR